MMKIHEHKDKKNDKDHFAHLVLIAIADGTIDENELKMLRRFGYKIGFSESEIDYIIKSTTYKSDYNPPSELSKRFEQVYDIVKLILADELIDKNEMHLAKVFAIKSGFQDNEIPGLLVHLVHGIKDGLNEDELFEIYKKKRKPM